MDDNFIVKSVEMIKAEDGLQYLFQIESTSSDKKHEVKCSVELINKVISTASMYVKGRVKL